MKHRIYGSRLIISIDADEQEKLWDKLKELMESGENHESDELFFEFIEPLTCNSELKRVYPEETGDLTDAPMLGVLGPEEPETGDRLAENWKEDVGIQQAGDRPIMQRWAFMDYQIRSPIQDLAEKGEVVFVS